LNTIPITNEEIRNKINETFIFVEPEFYDKRHRAVFLQETFEHYAKFVTINSLDICHIGFVHTFGNKESPNPLHLSKIIKINDTNYHYKISYKYLAGNKSLVKFIYNHENIVVENEYELPHSTVARVIFGNFSSTIITHALPVSKFKTILFVKEYRNYWYSGEKELYLDIFNPFKYLINFIGDKFTYETMVTTLKQDKAIVNYIDKTDYKLMHGKFSIIYDLFSNHYKNNYKRFYENEDSF
jgi:hypothetical protein